MFGIANLIGLFSWKKSGAFIAGAAFGVVAARALTSDTAKQIYAEAIAVLLRAKDRVVATADSIQAHVEDAVAQAAVINATRENESSIEG